MKTVAIIQARSGSSRLPNKINMDLRGKTVLQRCVNRVKKAKTIDETWLAMPRYDKGIDIDGKKHFGSENDVLSRYFWCAVEADAEIIVRITADCPLIDPEIIDETVEFFLKSDGQYVSNRLEAPGYPDGQDVEVFTFEALNIAHAFSMDSYDREHVTPFIKDAFLTRAYKAPVNLLDVRMTLDTIEDYDFLYGVVGKLIEKHGEKTWTLKEIMEVM